MPLSNALTASAIAAALGYTPANVDANGGVGSIALLQHATSNTAITVGNSYAGSSLIRGDMNAAGSGSPIQLIASATVGNMTGTWRALTGCAAQSTAFGAAIFQRIA